MPHLVTQIDQIIATEQATLAGDDSEDDCA